MSAETVAAWCEGMGDEPKFPDVEVELVGHDGNAFAIIGKVAKAIRRAHGGEAATGYTEAATSCESYDELLQLTMRTVFVS